MQTTERNMMLQLKYAEYFFMTFYEPVHIFHHQLMWKVHIGWVMMGLGCPVVGLTIMNWTNPMRLVFLSSLFCTSDEDCPEYDVVLSILEQNVAMLYVYFTYYIYDVLPISFSFYVKGSMKVSHIICIDKSFIFW